MPFPSAETTPPVMKMKRVSGRLWRHQVSGKSSVLDRSGGVEPHAAASSSLACRRAALSVASAPSIRHSSSTTPSPWSASTVVSAVSVVGRLLDPEVRARQRRDLRQVGDAEHLAGARRARAGAPPPPGRSARRRRRPPRRTRACATRPCRPRSSAPASRARARRPTRPRGSAPPGHPGWAPASARPARRRSAPTSSRGSSTHLERRRPPSPATRAPRAPARRASARPSGERRRASPAKLIALAHAPPRARPRPARSPPPRARGASRSARQRSACASTAATLPPCLRSSRS